LIVIAILTRRLREGTTYEDFREAWLPVIEPAMTRRFYVQVAEDDFTNAPPRE
jgi:hypothetical protein